MIKKWDMQKPFRILLSVCFLLGVFPFNAVHASSPIMDGISSQAFQNASVSADSGNKRFLNEDLAVALLWVQEQTTITGSIASGIVATFPATIPQVVIDAGFQINSKINLGSPLPVGTTVTITRNGSPYLTDVLVPGTEFWITDLFGYPLSYAAPFDDDYSGQVETYMITVNNNSYAIDTILTLSSIISRDIFVNDLFILAEESFDLLDLDQDPILEAALLQVIADTTLSGSIAAGITATFPLSIPQVVIDAGYQINSKIILSEALPFGSTVTITRNGNPYITDITLTGTEFWITDLFGYPLSYAAAFNEDYSGQIETYMITVSGNSYAIDSTLTLSSIISRDVFVSELVSLEEETFALSVDADLDAAIDLVVNETTLTGSVPSGILATFPLQIPPVIVAEPFKINSQILLDEPLPSGSKVSVTRNGFLILDELELVGTGPFWITDLIPGALPAEFDANYGASTELYLITITDNPFAIDTYLTLNSIISRDGFETELVILAEEIFELQVNADLDAALELIIDQTTLTGTLDNLTATFPLLIPPVIDAENYKINSRMSLTDPVPSGTTISIELSVNGGAFLPYVTNADLPGQVFWITDFFPAAAPSDFDGSTYNNRMETYRVTITGPGGNPLAISTSVLIESIISKDNFATEVLLADISLPVNIPADESAALTWLQDNTELSSLSGTIADLTATFPASIPPVIIDEDYLINSRMTLTGDGIPTGSTISIMATLDGVGPFPYVTNAVIPASTFWVTELFDPEQDPAGFNANYAGRIEIYSITINSAGGNPLELNGNVLVESIISKDGFSSIFVLDDINLTYSIPADEAAALLWLQANTVLSSVSGMVDDLTATFSLSIPPVIVDLPYFIDSRMTLAEALPAGTTVTVYKDGVAVLTDITLSGVGPFWFTELFDPDAPRAAFDANYGGKVEEYVIVVTGPGGNPLDFDTTVLIESVISKDGFVTETVLDDITLGVHIDDAVAPTIASGVAKSAANGDVALVNGKFTVDQGYMVDSIEITMDEPVLVDLGTIVTMVGYGPYGTVTAHDGALITITPYPGNKIAALIGTFTFTVPDGSITDLRGNGFVGNITLEVLNVAPMAGDDMYSTLEDTLLTVTPRGVLTNDTDFSPSSLTAVLVTGPTHGTLTLNPDGSFTYMPALNFFGSDTFVYEANDGLADSNDATVTITITPENDSPVAVDDFFSVVEDNVLNVAAPGVMANDIELDPDNMTVTLITDVTNGSLSLLADGSFIYTPDLNFFGTDTFIYELVTYPGLLSEWTDQATVTITVNPVNDAPVLDPIGNKTTDELVALTFTAIGTDVEVPAQTLTFSLDGEPTGASIDPVTGDFTWTPTEEQGPGEYTFTVKVCDNGTPVLCDEEVITVTVNEVNTAPTLGAIGDKTVDEETQLAFTAIATDADLPAQTLIFSLVGAPTGASIDPASGAFTWTPTEAQGPGSYTFDVCVSDGSQNDCETITITVNEVNKAPVLEPISDKTINELVELTFTAIAADDDLPVQTLTFSLVGAPTGASIDPITGVFTWTPTEEQGYGVYTFDVCVSDSDLNHCITVIVTVNEVNVAPILGAIGDKIVDEETLLSFTATANDDDLPAQLLTFSLVGAPTGASIDPSTGVFTWTPTEEQGYGVYSFTFMVCDNGNPILCDEKEITVIVNEINTAPTAEDQTETTNEDTPIDITLDVFDLEDDPLTVTIITEPTHGDLTISGIVVTYTPDLNYFGTDTFTYLVNDGLVNSNEATVTITINPVNDAPIAYDQTVRTFVNTPVEITLDGEDPEGDDAQSWDVVTQPINGSIECVGRYCTYTPNTNFIGTDSFTFTITDEFDAVSEPGLVTIYVDPFLQIYLPLIFK